MRNRHAPKRRHAAPAPPRAGVASAIRLPVWAIALLVAAIAAVAYRGALGYFFAQDDFAGLARAAGVLPRLAGPWRYLSGQLYFDTMRLLAGLDPFPYRLVSLAAHAANAVLLFALISRRASREMAFVGAAFYAAHPALFTAVYSISGIGELLSTGFALATLLLLDSRRARLLALPAFAASLLCKETTLLLPLVAVLLPREGGRRWRDPLVAALAAIAIADAAVLVAGNTFGVRGGLAANAAYSAGAGAHGLANLLTYAGWSVDVIAPLVTSFTDAVDRRVWPMGVALLAGMALACAWRPTRERGALVASAWMLAMLAFVLPLRHHTYHYYLTAPLAGVAWLLAAALDAIAARAWGAAPAGRPDLRRLAGVALLAALFTWSGAALIRRVETHPLVDPRMRSDPTVDRARIARLVRDGLAGAALPDGVRLTFWSPRVLQPGLTAAQAADTTRDTYWETNVQSALLGDVGVRVLFPRVASVRFARRYAPDSTARWAVYGCDGLTKVVSDAELATMLREDPTIR